MKKNVWYIIVIGLIFFGTIFYKFYKSINYKKEKKVSIAILQTLSHPALDLVVSSCIERLKSPENNGSSRIVSVFNGQGVISTLHTIAQRIASDKDYDLLISVGTPATQALYNCYGLTPIMFAAVTDTKALGILDHKKMTGITDMIDLSKQVHLIETLLPKALRIGIINNPSDPGSIVQYKKFVDLFEQKGYQVVSILVQGIQDLGVAINQAVRKIDLLLVPVDNVIAIGIGQVVAICDQYGIPIVVSDALLVSKGALAGCGVDYAALGYQTAERAISFLSGNVAFADFQIASVAESVCHVNRSRFEKLNKNADDFDKKFVWE